MACGTTVGECTENGDGFRIRTHMPQNSGFGNLLRYNYFEEIGYNGVDVFGPETTLERNIFFQTCFTKADCGAVRTFGGGSLASTPVYNLHLIENLIVDIPGNVDGCEASRAPFGFGLYVDNYSRDVETRGNTIMDTTAAGILYQRSSGTITDNTVFNAAAGTAYSAQIDLGGSETRAAMSGNVMYGLTAKRLDALHGQPEQYFKLGLELFLPSVCEPAHCPWAGLGARDLRGLESLQRARRQLQDQLVHAGGGRAIPRGGLLQ